MKKQTSKLLLFMMVLVMAFSLAACGVKKSNSKENERKESTKEQEKQSEKEEEQNKDDKKKNALYDSVTDYVNSDETQSVLNNLKGSLPEGMSIDLVAEGDNKLVYAFAYETIAHTEGDGMPEALESAIGAQDATFQQTANSVKSFVGSDEVLVEIRYVDMNGAVIFSKTYTSEQTGS